MDQLGGVIADVIELKMIDPSGGDGENSTMRTAVPKCK
jgi:hypothetical protein